MTLFATVEEALTTAFHTVRTISAQDQFNCYLGPQFYSAVNVKATFTSPATHLARYRSLQRMIFFWTNAESGTTHYFEKVEVTGKH